MPKAENPLLVLGSGSPRRAALLQQIGLPFVQWACGAEEALPPGGPPDIHALAAARDKARAVQCQVRDHYPPDRRILVIGADTVVHLDGQLLGKPLDEADAARMLRVLSGRTHQVCTGLALWGSDGFRAEDCAVTQVRMRPLSAAEIQHYVRGGEPADKAGAYGIQGAGACFVEHLDGCYYNVVGLPLARLSALLAGAGYDFSKDCLSL